MFVEPLVEFPPFDRLGSLGQTTAEFVHRDKQNTRIIISVVLCTIQMSLKLISFDRRWHLGFNEQRPAFVIKDARIRDPFCVDYFFRYFFQNVDARKLLLDKSQPPRWNGANL